MNLKLIFKRLGLGLHSAEVYECLKNSKEAMLIADIAVALGVARMTVYRCIDELLARGFVAKNILGKRSYYEAGSSQMIDEEFKKLSDKVTEFTEKKLLLKRGLPNNAQYLSGFLGIRAIFDDVVKNTPKGEVFYRYTSERNLEKVNKYLSADYREVRDKKKLERLVISNSISGNQKRPRLERFIKYIPSGIDSFDQNTIQLIYADRLAFINLNKEDGFIIKDKSLADFQKVIFRQLYKKLS